MSQFHFTIFSLLCQQIFALFVILRNEKNLFQIAAPFGSQ